MQTHIHSSLDVSPGIGAAKDILKACVHCGFCNATCPTYLEQGDERDGPRGRIYLIKQLLENGSAGPATRTHLDRCLSCRSCETTCPSGVQYGRLLDLGRGVIEEQQTRPLLEQLQRWGLRQVVPYRRRFAALLRVGQWLRPLLPAQLARKIPAQPLPAPWPHPQHQRSMLALAGCVQPGATPNTNAAAARVLSHLGINLVEIEEAGCCGAMVYHLGEHDSGLNFARRNIDTWWPEVEAGAEALVMTASGCGSMVKEYGHLLCDDPAYAERARRISELARDLSEVLLDEDLSGLNLNVDTARTAVHCPCSLQHAQQLPDTLRRILEDLGFSLTTTREDHVCCGSAGTYSILQPELAQRLLTRKLTALATDQPERIVTANVGCQLHLASGSTLPVQHWIEIVDAALP